MADEPLAPLPGAREGRDPARAIKRGPSRVPPEEIAANQRDRLFDALVHTVAQKGYANATVSDICRAAGVTRPAFYALFAGKEDALIATYRHGTDLLLTLMERAYLAEPAWRDGARAALRVMLQVLAELPAFAVVAVVEIDAAGPPARAERARLLRRFDRFFAEAPQAAALPMPEELVETIVGGIYATVYRYVAAGRVEQLPALLPTLSYFTLVPFVGREEAALELDGAPTGMVGAMAAGCRSTP
ncbi:TetR/AcrR family transcriptional regulator [Dactylosporangium roseum]|uniref:TetR/AcrR family transcriptional regulator n=1 Tax=Dactylosporangium roseum TaxID=47989 RepID=A0ABY5Z923_9ACTN|nr:TetR/AcrR family transcriptional regulator [Dactylosporangium roseum]UWZ38559.1 TetR/AcrR family transcriptional regulator [Dactylosporangium roseum]